MSEQQTETSQRQEIEKLFDQILTFAPLEERNQFREQLALVLDMPVKIVDDFLNGAKI